jgi:hypothetical protein
MAMHVPNALVEATKQRQVVLFAGAGMSYGALGILGRDVRDAIANDIKKDYPDYDASWRSFEDVCDEYVALNDRQTLVNRLAGLIDQNAKPMANHVAAVKAFRFIVTTNWDLLFEAAYRQIGQHYQVLSSNADAPNFNYDSHNLLKIHGSVDRPLTLIATSEDYEAYPDTTVSFWRVYKSCCTTTSSCSWVTRCEMSTSAAYSPTSVVNVSSGREKPTLLAFSILCGQSCWQSARSRRSTWPSALIGQTRRLRIF